MRSIWRDCGILFLEITSSKEPKKNQVEDFSEVPFSPQAFLSLLDNNRWTGDRRGEGGGALSPGPKKRKIYFVSTAEQHQIYQRVLFYLCHNCTSFHCSVQLQKLKSYKGWKSLYVKVRQWKRNETLDGTENTVLSLCGTLPISDPTRNKRLHCCSIYSYTSISVSCFQNQTA